MSEPARVDFNVSGDPAPAGDPTPAAVTRPDHIPEKFWDTAKGEVRVEEMARSYGELEKRIGAPKAPDAPLPSDAPATAPIAPDAPQPDAPVTAQLDNAGIKYADLQSEYLEHGKLSDESYAKLAKAGFERSEVDAQIEGIQAKADLYRMQALQGAGLTEDSFVELAQWAKTNLGADDLAAYNRQTAPGVSLADATAALKNLVARQEQAGGREPGLMSVRSHAPSADVYRDRSEMMADMRDPRYAVSEAFRAQVASKLERSSIL